MRKNRRAGASWVALALTAAAILVLALPGAGMGASAAKAKPCFDSNYHHPISNRKNISCAAANKVYQKAGNIPQCRGQKSVRRNGWLYRGVGRKGHHVNTQATKGKQAFHVYEGGYC